MKKVLLVDDNDNLLKLLKALLENKGFDVATSERGADVVNLVQWLKPDIVVMDILMGKSNGYDIYTALKQNINTRKTPVLLMCTDDIDECITLMHLKLEEVISKPFDFKHLMGKIKILAA